MKSKDFNGRKVKIVVSKGSIVTKAKLEKDSIDLKNKNDTEI